MAENKDGQEKTEEATGKKLDDARKEGQSAKSMEINSFSIFVFGLLILYAFKSFIGSELSDLSTYIFSHLHELDIQFSIMRLYFIKGVVFFFILLSPVLLGLVIVALATGFAQVGLRVSPKAIKPKFSKLNPAKGLKEKIFSTRSLIELLKSFAKLAIIGIFVYNVLVEYVAKAQGLVELSISEVVDFMVDGAVDLLMQVAMAFAIVAAVDFLFQKNKFKKDMMMTKQEVKEEGKQTEGSPEIKQRIKKEQFLAAKKRMMDSVPKADVVITNPTHYAIALKYEPGKSDAPEVVAKGVDSVAQRIKKIATENDVPLYEDRELARALYKICNIGDKIPENLFHAVAQILAYVYKVKKMKKSNSII